ncbi:MAG: iron chelate uptake ABC transporter family permease subunit [Gemmatimonas sp.]|nr:iron chelate uptake ABC transporter family permease subunit [Gemmatimonas sp.]
MTLPFVLDFTLRTVAIGAAVLGIVSGTLGTYAVLRGQSLLGDAISHAALPGIAVAFLLTGVRSPVVLVLGAAAAGWIGALLVLQISKQTRIPYDASLGLVLSVFFGFGMVLLTFIQRLPSGNQAGLDTFLFGQAAALLPRDVVVMSVLGLIAISATILLWKELKLLAFDREFGASIGLPMRALDVTLTSLLVFAIVIGLQTVGVVLMSAILIAPAAAARQWSDRLGRIVLLAALFGAAAGVTGAVISASTPRLPTGPTIVLCAGAIMLVSLLAAPRRGLLAAHVRSRRSHRNLRELGVLEDMYTLARHHEDPLHPHPAVVLRTMTSGPESVQPGLRGLERRGWARRVDGDLWALTDSGLESAHAEFAAPVAGEAPGVRSLHGGRR